MEKADIRVKVKVRDSFMRVKPINVSSSDFTLLLLTLWEHEYKRLAKESERMAQRLAAGLDPVISYPGDPDFIRIEGEDLSNVNVDEMKEVWARLNYLLTNNPPGRKPDGRPKGAKDKKPRKAYRRRLPLEVGA